MARFVIATLGMVALLTAGLMFGGLWAVAALTYITVFTHLMDKLTALVAPDRPGAEFPAGDGLSVALALLHLPLLYGGAAVVGGATEASPATRVVMFFALSLFFGQVSNSNAHELIHRGNRRLRALGVMVYSSLLFGHHASAHPKVHHVHAATPRDPNSAPLGLGFYAFALRAWTGSFRQGWQVETAQRKGRGLHPYAAYLGGAILSLVLATIVGGAGGAVALVAMALYAQMQLLLSDYVQHYGLRRREIAPGRYEPVGPRHSWNAPQGFSSALMLNAPRHSDHHAHPGRHYPRLELDRAAMPILPYSLPVMAVLALMPSLWRRVMDPRVRAWTARSGGEASPMARAS